MTDIIEIMARAIAEQRTEGAGVDRQACAALNAVLDHMQEPSEASINCGGVAIWDGSAADFHDLSRGACRSAAISGWHAMTDQYRKEAMGD